MAVNSEQVNLEAAKLIQKGVRRAYNFRFTVAIFDLGHKEVPVVDGTVFVIIGLPKQHEIAFGTTQISCVVTQSISGLWRPFVTPVNDMALSLFRRWDPS